MSISKGSNKSKFSFSEAINNTLKPDFEQGKSETIKTTTKKEVSPPIAYEEANNRPVGRPYLGKVKRITLAIPVEYLKAVKAGAVLDFEGNITAYINSLIEQDIKVNQSKYEPVMEMLDKNKKV